MKSNPPSSNKYSSLLLLALRGVSFCLQIIVFSWILGFGIIGINVYYLSTAFVHWLLHNDLARVANVFIGILVFPIMAIYLVGIIYLTFRKDQVVTFEEPVKHQVNIESGVMTTTTTSGHFDKIPYREDLAEITLPE